MSETTRTPSRSTVVGGLYNDATSSYVLVGGASGNTDSGLYSTSLGGFYYSTADGSYYQSANTSYDYEPWPPG